MPFAAKSSLPIPSNCTYRHPTYSQAAHSHRIIYTCLPGYLDTECLLSELLEQQRRVVWLRLEPEDGDPATFMLSMIQAAAMESTSLAGELPKNASQPGPVFGWAPLFRRLGRFCLEH
jgi:hypothetical protein